VDLEGVVEPLLLQDAMTSPGLNLSVTIRTSTSLE
jgi:hypothetical protein